MCGLSQHFSYHEDWLFSQWDRLEDFCRQTIISLHLICSFTTVSEWLVAGRKIVPYDRSSDMKLKFPGLWTALLEGFV